MPNSTKGCVDYIIRAPPYVALWRVAFGVCLPHHSPFIARLADVPTIYRSYKLPLLFPRGGRSSDPYALTVPTLHPLTSWIQTPQAAGDLPSVSVTRAM